jgi:hypothetical protein
MEIRTLRGDHNQCPTCKEYFNSTRAFDAHRVGPYGQRQRRCLTVPEMLAKGMGKNKGDWWVTSIGKRPVSSFRERQNASATEFKLPT